MDMLKKVRVALACLLWIGITLLFLDFTGTLHTYLGWMAKVQALPALLALNVGVIVGLVLLTLVFGRVYCSVICPLGVFQDAVSHIGTLKNKKPYKYHKEMKWLRYGVWVLFVAALIAGFNAFVAILAPYSAYGRIVQSLLQPIYIWGNNLLAMLSERAGGYTFYSKEVWFRSVSTIIVATVTLIVIVGISLKGGRAYCNSVCPVGTTLSFFSRFAMFRPVIDNDKCKHCKACELHCKAHCISIKDGSSKIDYSRCVDCFNCLDKRKFGALEYKYAWKKEIPGQAGNDKTVTPDSDRASGRRAMIAGTVAVVGAAALKGVEARAQKAVTKMDGGFADVLPKQAPQRTIPITPPGSINAKRFHQHCTACQLCVAACPNNVLRPSSRPEHFMQPELSFEKGWCRPECTKCSQVCPSSAISEITREEKTEYHLGTSRVNLETCLSASGTTHCGKCAQICPTGAIHMVINEENGNRYPVVVEEICIGCGACEFYCPVRPVSAITINGRFQHV